MFVWQSQLLPVRDVFGPLTPDYYPYQGQGPRKGWGVSWSQAQSSGTVCQPLCEPQLSHRWHSL